MKWDLYATALRCIVAEMYGSKYLINNHNLGTIRAKKSLWFHDDVTSRFPSQRPVTRNFDVFFDLRLNKRLSKQSIR